MKTRILSIILLISTSLIACKKENTTQSAQATTAKQKLIGKWNLVSEVANNFYGGFDHITTYPYPAGDYTEFTDDGKMIEFKSGTSATYYYGFVSDSKLWIIYNGNYFDIKILTNTDLQLYSKDEYPPNEYNESTLNLKR